MSMGESVKRACKWWQTHKWSAWSDPEPGLKTSFRTGKEFGIEVQERRCERCGYKELRECS